MEGLLLGTVRRARDPRLRGCEVQAAYRLHFDPSEQGGSGGVAGTLEGAVVCDCGGGPERVCIELGTLAAGPGPNPRVEQGVTFHVHDFAGTPVGNTHVRTLGAFTGLDVDRRVEIALPGPCSAVEATLVTFAAPATLEATNSDGSLAGSAKMTGSQQVAETLSLSGASIERAVITAPSGETLLLRWCFEPLAR
jgi:hypothetical protein